MVSLDRILWSYHMTYGIYILTTRKKRCQVLMKLLIVTIMILRIQVDRNGLINMAYLHSVREESTWMVMVFLEVLLYVKVWVLRGYIIIAENDCYLYLYYFFDDFYIISNGSIKCRYGKFKRWKKKQR